ncbi:MAG: hypothetical protein IEMM0002_0048 [bacterium]|nr:MAG: hypothetical protein IEMM0002_0048 [bacterium]
MKKFGVLIVSAIMVLAFSGPAHAFFIDFEDGVDGGSVNDIAGVSFLDFNGYDARYGDCSTGNYNCTSDDLGYGTGGYHHNGNFFLWAGPNADAQGVIVDFTSNDGTWFSTGYSSYSNFNVHAYFTDGTNATVGGASNYGGPMSYLTINAGAGQFIDYVVLHDSGNYWMVDDMSGDATGVNPVPEPATILLLGSGLIGLGFFARKRKTA